MCDRMTFPDTVEEFMEQYKVVDTDGIYMSKGAELVPIFRMRQWFEHLPSAQPEIVRCKDCKYQVKGEDESESWNLCGYRPWNYANVTDNHYCGYAERRTDEND